ncbi:hypothetical protein [Priestia megaterium]|uniref:hypothetical protein n=1 Tax=Priestia megaterium TaxID=1404 RepID=UPI003D0078DB
MTYDAFCSKIQRYDENEFQQFCNRFQKIMNRKFRATKAIGPLGDLSNDGIISSTSRLAVYGVHQDTMDKDGKIASKMKADFTKMLRTHPMVSCMVFMTRTEKGMGPKTQKMKQEIESKSFQKQIYEDLYEESKHSLSAQTIEYISRTEIEYVDCLDCFEKLRDISKVTTWEYLLDNKLTLSPVLELPNKQLDDPAFIAEWLQSAVIRYDNYEAPISMKYEELQKLEQSLLDKIKRDLRKYNVDNIVDIPYEKWDIIGILTPYSQSSISYSAAFEVPTAIWKDRDDVITLTLTPDILLYIVNRMNFYILSANDPSVSFTDLFLKIYRLVEVNRLIVERPEEDEWSIKSEVAKKIEKWRTIMAEWVVQYSN